MLSTGEVLHGYVTAQVRQIEGQETGVRTGATDAVHKMRVAARRLRSVLVTYRRAVEAGRVDTLAAELTWLTGALGEARDSEVVLDRLAELLAEQPDELVAGPVSHRLHLELDGRLAAGRAAAVRALDSPRYEALRQELDAFVATPPLAPSAAGDAARQLPQPLARVLRRLDVRMREAEQADIAEDRERLLHRVRKSAKRLRYAAELTSTVIGSEASAVADIATTLQEILGQHHDSVVTRAALRTLAEEAELHGESAFTYGRLHALEELRAAALEDDYDAAARQVPAPSMVAGWERLAGVAG